MDRRKLSTLLVLGVVLAGGAGCRTSPNAAAYVGDTQLSTDALDAEVADRLADPDIATYAGDDRATYTRQVLSLQLEERVYDAVARRYDAEVTDADVEARIDELLQGNDRGEVFAQLEQEQGVTADDVVENVRQQLVRQRVAASQGLADLSEEALRATYDQAREGLARIELGYVTVPDQATADTVLAQLVADPAGYPALAAQYAGPATLPEIQPLPADQVPQGLVAQVSSVEPGQGFTLPVPEAGGVLVGFVRGIVYPTFDEARGQLAEQAATEAEGAVTGLVDDVREDLDITVNPRYGSLTDGSVQLPDDGVVQILQDAGADTTAAAGD